MRDAFVLDTLRVMFLGMGLLVLVATAFTVIALTGSARIIAIFLGLLLAGVFFGVHRLAVSNRIPTRFAHPLAALLGFFGLFYQLYHMVVDNQDVTAMQLVGLVLTMIAIGAVYLSLRWIVYTTIIVLGGWLVVVLATEPNPVWSEYIYLYIVLIVFTFFIFYGRQRAVSEMINAHMANRRQNEQLTETLERAHLSEAQLRAERDFADQIVESMAHGLILLDADERIEFANPSAEQILHLRSSPMIGRPFGDILHAGGDIAGNAGMLSEATRELRIAGDDGIERDIAFSSTPRPGGGSILTLSDLTLRKQFESELERLAHYDALTGLPNRALFLDRLTQAVKRLDRHDSRLAVLFMDLDRFKWINDTMGHAVGDQVLVETARRIERCIREHDTAARFGGDEFVVLLTDLVDAEEPLAIADRIVLEVQESHLLEGQYHAIRASIGIVMCQSPDGIPEDLINHADIAMYQAKRRRDVSRVLFTPDMDERVRVGAAFELDARRAAGSRL